MPGRPLFSKAQSLTLHFVLLCILNKYLKHTGQGTCRYKFDTKFMNKLRDHDSLLYTNEWNHGTQFRDMFHFCVHNEHNLDILFKKKEHKIKNQKSFVFLGISIVMFCTP